MLTRRGWTLVGLGILSTAAVSILTIHILIIENERSDVYIKPIPNAIVDLNPTRSRFRLDYMVARSVMGQILSSDFVGAIKPAFIKHWDIGNDATRFVFQIRSDVHFHSGKKAGIDDLIFTINFLAERKSLLSWMFENIRGYTEYVNGHSSSLSGVYKTGPNEITVDLVRPSYVFLSNLTDPKVVLLPNRLNGLSISAFFENPDGIGPYSVNGKVTDRSFELVRYNRYYLGKPKISTYRFIVMDEREATEQFALGNVFDLEAYSLSSETKSRLMTIGSSFKVGAYSGTSLFFNGKSNRVQDLLLRKWIANGVDMKNATVQCGISILPASGFIPKGAIGWTDPEMTLYDHTEKVNRINQSQEIRLLSYGGENNSCLLKAIVSQLKVHGVNIKHLHVDPDQALRIFSSNKYDLLFDHLSMRGAEPFYLLAYISPHSQHNLLKFTDPWITRAVNMIKQAPNDTVRSAFYRDLDQYICRRKTYMIPLYDDVRDYYFNNRVHGPFLPAIISLNTGFDEIWID